MLGEAACLQLAKRLFQSFAPLNEKHFLPFSVPFFGNLRSVDVPFNMKYGQRSTNRSAGMERPEYSASGS